MSFGIGSVTKTLSSAVNPTKLLPNLAATALKTVAPVAAPVVDKATQAMFSKLQDGFETSSSKSAPSSSTTTAPTAPAKKKKKKKHGLFHKLGGLLKKALPMVSKIANFIPGLNAVTKPLELLSSFTN